MNKLSGTIFVVDDDDSVRTSLVRLLKSAGHPVAAFASAEDFLRDMPCGAHGCLVVDVHMSGMSGIELLRVLPADRSIPAIVITAYEDAETRRAATEAGVVAFLKKPFDDSLLLDAVAQALHGDLE